MGTSTQNFLRLVDGHLFYGNADIDGFPLELMQFTGMHDKNGKEIYEGDIVQHRRLTRPTDTAMYGSVMQLMPTKNEVVFEACGFRPFSGWIESATVDLEYEVIGNIHENPELLDAAQIVR